MEYEDAFAAVPGVTVEWFHYAGHSSGLFVAKIRVEGQEEPQYILDDYGSCSHCDALEREFYYDRNPSQEGLAEFGRPYVEAALSLDEVMAKLLPVPGKWYDQDKQSALMYVLEDHPEKAALLSAQPQGTA